VFWASQLSARFCGIDFVCMAAPPSNDLEVSSSDNSFGTGTSGLVYSSSGVYALSGLLISCVVSGSHERTAASTIATNTSVTAAMPVRHHFLLSLQGRVTLLTCRLSSFSFTGSTAPTSREAMS